MFRRVSTGVQALCLVALAIASTPSTPFAQSVTGTILGTWVHPAFYGLAAFVGAGLTFAGLTDWCGMAMLLAKMPWNQRGGGPATSCSV